MIEDDYFAGFTWSQLQNRDDIEISIDGGNSWQQMDLGCILRQVKKEPTTWYARMWLGDHGEGEYEVNVSEVMTDKYLTYEVPEDDFSWYGKFVRWLGDWQKVEV